MNSRADALAQLLPLVVSIYGVIDAVSKVMLKDAQIGAAPVKKDETRLIREKRRSLWGCRSG